MQQPDANTKCDKDPQRSQNWPVHTVSEEEIPTLSLEDLKKLEKHLKSKIEWAQILLCRFKIAFEIEKLRNSDLAMSRHLTTTTASSAEKIEEAEKAWKESLKESIKLKVLIDTLSAELPRLENKLMCCRKNHAVQLSQKKKMPKFLGKIITCVKLEFQSSHRNSVLNDALSLADSGSYAASIFLLETLVNNDKAKAKRRMYLCTNDVPFLSWTETWEVHFRYLESLGLLALAYEKIGMFYKAMDCAEEYIATLDNMEKEKALRLYKAVTFTLKNNPTARAHAQLCRLQKRLGREQEAKQSQARVGYTSEVLDPIWFDQQTGNILKMDIYEKPHWQTEDKRYVGY